MYGLVFLITGAVLLTIGYALVGHNIGGLHLRRNLGRLGASPILSPRPPGFGAGPGDMPMAIFKQLHSQLVTGALHRLLAEYVLALGLMTVISVAAGWFLAGRALAPLRDITATARRVSGEDLGERIGLVGPADELKELADTFDGMLGRLDAASKASVTSSPARRTSSARRWPSCTPKSTSRWPIRTPGLASCGSWGRRCVTPSIVVSA